MNNSLGCGEQLKNILTIDLEEWFHANYHENIFDNTLKYKVRVVESTNRLLDLFSEHKVKATFFVLGYIAQNHPGLVREIYDRGHEIATHGYGHELVYKQMPEEFRQDVQKSTAVIEDVINDKVIGYRAPSWSITEKSLWALEILEEEGLVYDASIFPVKNYLYGIPTANRFKHQPVYKEKELDIIEIPMSTIRLFNNDIPFSGGAYFRILPFWFIKYGIKKLNNEGNPAIVYLHPREIDTGQPKLKLNFIETFIHYAGISACEKKLLKLLGEFQFTSIKEYYNLASDLANKTFLKLEG